MFLRNGQQKEAIGELSKENLKDVTNPKTKIEIIELVTKLFPEATNERLPTIPDDAPRVLVSPDEIFKQWLKKAVQKIKAYVGNRWHLNTSFACTTNGRRCSGFHRQND